MPEGDTIRRLAAEVRHQVGGRRVARSVFRHPRLATLDLAGRTLVDATANGKHLFLHWDDGWSLHIHLLMDGRVRFGDPRSTAAGVEEWRRRFEITFEVAGGDPAGPNRAMVGVDIPLLHHLRTDETPRLVDHLGPDLCGRFGPEELEVAVARVAGAGHSPLAGALLDQRRVAGFGNIYAVEVPFIVGLSPFRAAADIERLDHLLAVGAALIRTNAELGPQNTTGRRLHQADHWVLGERTTTCGRCGGPVRRSTGEQTPWRRRAAWCPVCQPDEATAVDLARARSLLTLHPARRRLRYLDDSPPGVELIGSSDPVTPRRPPGTRRSGRPRR